MKTFTTTVRVTYKDTDQMGVVYYAHYLVWFKIARTELFRQAGVIYKRIEEEMGLRLPVIEARCRYKQPARYDDLISIDCSLMKMGNSSMSFDYRVRREDMVLAEGETLHVFIDDSGKPKRIPPGLKEALT